MNTFIISIRNNVLQISSEGNPSEIVTVALSSDITSGSEIKDTSLLAETLGQALIDNFPSSKKHNLTFLVEPEEILLNFITDTKKAKDPESYLVGEVGKKLAAKALTLEDVYFSYQKIAPFVYQFVAIKQKHLEKYLEI